MPLIDHVADISREAGRLLLEFAARQTLRISEKGSPFDFVTEADLASQALIKQRVAELSPSDRVIGEEDGLPDPELLELISRNPGGERLWLVDPLDGTLNFIRGFGGYGVSIAVFEGSEVCAGAIYLPETNELYLAESGSGAWRNGARLHVAERSRLSECVCATYMPVSSPEWRSWSNLWQKAVSLSCLSLRMQGAAVFNQSRVAAGGLDIYYDLGPHPWDLAAGALLVREAGGIVTRMDGGPFDLGRGGVLATSAAIHEQAQRMLASAGIDLTAIG